MIPISNDASGFEVLKRFDLAIFRIHHGAGCDRNWWNPMPISAAKTIEIWIFGSELLGDIGDGCYHLTQPT